MPRDGAIIFRDIVGKLTVLRITCDKCGRSGQYRVDRLIVRYGIDAKLFDWSDEITADCPRSRTVVFRALVSYAVWRGNRARAHRRSDLRHETPIGASHSRSSLTSQPIGY